MSHADQDAAGVAAARPRPRRAEVTRRAAPKPDPAAAAALAAFVRKVTSADPACLPGAAADVLARSTPAVLAVLIDALVAALTRPGTPAGRAAVAEVLAGLGPAAVPWVNIALLKATTGRQQADLAGVLGRVIPRLPPGERVEQQVFLVGIAGRALDAGAAAAIGAALDAS